jgi:uncharacterized membrane protein HdeD (DUF308 family)
MHGMLDYPAGILLIAAPWIFGFSDIDAARNVAIIIGALVIVQSLITDYEFSIADILPLSAHLMMDVLAGIVLAASPWIFGFADEGTAAWLPHLVFGLGLLAAGLMTQRERETARTSQGTTSASRTTAGSRSR